MGYKRKINLQAWFDLKSGSCVECSLGSSAIRVKPGVGNLGTVHTSARTFWVAFNKTSPCGREPEQEQLHPCDSGTNRSMVKYFSNTEFAGPQLQPGWCPSLAGKVSVWYGTTGSTWIQAGNKSRVPLLMEMLGVARFKLVLSWESWMWQLQLTWNTLLGFSEAAIPQQQCLQAGRCK